LSSSLAGLVRPLPSGPADAGSASVWPRAPLKTAGFIAAVMIVVAVGCARGLGTRLSPGLLGLLGTGALVAQLRPRLARLTAVLVGAVALMALNPVFGAYFLALVLGLTVARDHRGAFAATALAGALLLPKLAFSRGYHTPGLWNWLNEPSLALILFVSALWWRHRWSDPVRRTGSADADASGAPTAGPLPSSLPDGPNRDDRGARGGDALSFLLLYLFPTHATNPMVLGPTVLWRPLETSVPEICKHLGWFLAKVAGIQLLQLRHHPLLPHPLPLLRELSGPMLADTSRTGLWYIVAASYVETYLLLAASADVPILVARLFGWPLAAPFRAPLLAWNPVELWRRWGIYNRQFLLRVVYFPLGGNRRHRYRNVILTFLASALLLHSGWFGSKYLEVGVAGWRDESLYFLLQGLAVCACLGLWQRTGKEVRGDRGLRWSGGRLLATLATQGSSALAHVVILAQGIDLATRFRLIGRCLGL
jgi:hypothetical protein